MSLSERKRHARSRTLTLDSGGRKRTFHAEKLDAVHLGMSSDVMMATGTTIGKTKDMSHWVDQDVDNWPDLVGGNVAGAVSGKGHCQARGRRRGGGKSRIMKRHVQQDFRHGTRCHNGLKNHQMSESTLAFTTPGAEMGSSTGHFSVIELSEQRPLIERIFVSNALDRGG